MFFFITNLYKEATYLIITSTSLPYTRLSVQAIMMKKKKKKKEGYSLLL